MRDLAYAVCDARRDLIYQVCKALHLPRLFALELSELQACLGEAEYDTKARLLDAPLLVLNQAECNAREWFVD